MKLNKIIVPRTFHILNDDGTISENQSIGNDLFNLPPYGVVESGKHLSVPSPLVESKNAIRRWRDVEQILSVDVEGAQIARMIVEYNRKHGTNIRMAAAFIVTDTPTAEGDPAENSYGLHDPDYGGKQQAKKDYTELLRLLWGMPGRHRPSNHTRLIGNYYYETLRTMQTLGDTVGLAVFYAEIFDRLTKVQGYSSDDRRVSFGINGVYADLIRILEKSGISPLNPEYRTLPWPLESLARLPSIYQRATILQSLTRSSTLNSGNVAFKVKDKTPQQVRASALQNAKKAVELILSKQTTKLTRQNIDRLHRLLNKGILKDEDLGRISEFNYQPLGGPLVSSEQVFLDFIAWLQTVTPSPLAALEAYQRFEHLHPYKDGNGRVAELIAQHMMIRATGHPFLFPHRFDIDYILSLSRNGAHHASNGEYLQNLIMNSKRFAEFLQRQIPELAEAGLDLTTGLVALTDVNGKRSVINLVFSAEHGIRLEREDRLFIDPGTDPRTVPLPNGFTLAQAPVVGSLLIRRAQYDVSFNLYRCSLPEFCEQPRPERCQEHLESKL